MGAQDALANEFAREHSERLWKQLIVVPDSGDAAGGGARRELLVVLALAVLAAVAFKVPALFGVRLGDAASEMFYARNMSFFVLPLLTGYFVWRRQIGPRTWIYFAGDQNMVILWLPSILLSILLSVGLTVLLNSLFRRS